MKPPIFETGQDSRLQNETKMAVFTYNDSQFVNFYEDESSGI